MKSWILAGAAALALVSPAKAMEVASLPSAPASFSWTGIYAGAQIGYGNFNDTSEASQGIHPTQIGGRFGMPARHSLTGGLFAGANYQFGSSVAGIEADVDFARYDSSRNPIGVLGAALINDEIRVRSGLQWSLRARLGHAVGPALIYLTAGPAVASFRTSLFDGYLGGTIAYSQARIGLTVGAGLDYAFTRNLIARAEYRYTDFGSFEKFTAGNPLTAHFWANRHVSHEIKQHSVRFGLSYLFATGG
jgi:outer membrane immunogenic protein